MLSDLFFNSMCSFLIFDAALLFFKIDLHFIIVRPYLNDYLSSRLALIITNEFLFLQFLSGHIKFLFTRCTLDPSGFKKIIRKEKNILAWYISNNNTIISIMLLNSSFYFFKFTSE